MLDQMAKDDMPGEPQLRIIAAASIDEQSEVWKKYKPRKADPQVSWHDVARALTKTRMYARHASFDDALATAYGIAWVEDLFAPADEDSRYTTDVEAFLGAQNEWITNHLPKRGTVIEVNESGQPKLPAKAERVWGKPGKSDCTGWYLDREGQIQSVAFRMPQPKKAKGKASQADETAADKIGTMAKPRPDVTRKGMEMIGDLRTDALHEALARAPIEDDTLLGLLVLAFAGQNVSIASGNANGYARIGRHAARLIGEDGKLAFDRNTLQQVARATLVDVLSCRRESLGQRRRGAHRRRCHWRRYVLAEHGHGRLSVVPVTHRDRGCVQGHVGASAPTGQGHARGAGSALRREPLRASGRVVRSRAREGRRLGRQTRPRRRRRGVRC
jgi:hypothetical protein